MLRSCVCFTLFLFRFHVRIKTAINTAFWCVCFVSCVCVFFCGRSYVVIGDVLMAIGGGGGGGGGGGN